MAIWDHEGKLEYRGWSQEHSLRIIESWLLSPPGKMLRCFVQSICDAILLKRHSGHEEVPDKQVLTAGSRGFSSDIPFSPLEAKATTRVAAAQMDFRQGQPIRVEPPI
jgi:hypothetical protein